MNIKSFEYMTIQNIFNSFLTNNITGILYNQVDSISNLTFFKYKHNNIVYSLFGNTDDPSFWFGRTDADNMGGYKDGSRREHLETKELPTNNEFITGIHSLAQSIGLFSKIIDHSGTLVNLETKTTEELLSMLYTELDNDGLIIHTPVDESVPKVPKENPKPIEPPLGFQKPAEGEDQPYMAVEDDQSEVVDHTD